MFSKEKIGERHKSNFIKKAQSEMVKTGVPKLDEVLSGGLRQQSTVLLCSQPGVENTEFALQALFNRLEAGDNGLYFVNNKSPESVKALALEYGWDLERYRQRGTFAFFDAYSALLSMHSKMEYILIRKP